jgi:cell division septation protein DedD
MASLGLGILIFAAGWFMGNMFRISETPTAQKKTVIRSQKTLGYKPKASVKIIEQKAPAIPKPQPEPAGVPVAEKFPAEKPETVISESTLEDVKEDDVEEKPPQEEKSPATESEPAGPESMAEEKKEAVDEEEQEQPAAVEEPTQTTETDSDKKPIAAIALPPAGLLYAVQVGAFLSRDNASRFVLRLNQKDYQAYIFQQTDARERVWHAVRIGIYQDLETARSDAAVFKDKEKMPAIVMYFDSLNPVYLEKDPAQQ